MADLQGVEEGKGIAGHLLEVVRGIAARAADSRVVERHDPPVRRQRVDQGGIPVVQVPAEMLPSQIGSMHCCRAPASTG